MVRCVDIGQQHVGQVGDMVEKLFPGAGAGGGGDFREGDVLARVEQFTHGPHIGDIHMAHFGGAQGMNELRGEQGIALDAFVDQIAGGDQAKPHRYRSDDPQADQ
ncbi:hypothetical protein D3C81_1356290 [compost metagenome]